MSDVIIIGAGPAGISAALYTIRSGLETTVIAAGDSALAKAEKIENYYGFAEPISGKELLTRGIDGTFGDRQQTARTEHRGLDRIRRQRGQLLRGL